MDRFELPVFLDAAAQVKDDLAQGVPMGTSTSPGFFTRPAREKTLVPLLFSVPMAANHSAPLVDDHRDIGPGFHVVDDRGLAPKALLGRIGRAVAGLADIAFDKVDERGLFAADIGAGAPADLDIEAEGRAQDLVSQETLLFGLGDGLAQPRGGQGIFVADVDEALAGADGIGADDHALHDGVGVALHHGPVHERPRGRLRSRCR